ncbi:GA-like domain-containing protein [Lysinibacillus sp. UGB7]|uniref:GA-like domain-containing protein n=1 Tax=Lysinibacillus sp. UGB7 TaxID=3411039 RepID=UPI003B760CCC
MTKQKKNKNTNKKVIATLAVAATGAAVVGIPSVIEGAGFNKAEAETWAFAGGSGTIADPYQIATFDQLKLVAQNYTSYFVLTADIDMNHVAWSPIGNAAVPFNGHVDGNGFKIKNVNVTTGNGYGGLFGYISGGSVKNLTIENISVVSTAGDYIGGVVGYGKNAKIENVMVEGNNQIKTTAGSYVGMIAGYLTGAPTSGSFAASKVAAIGTIDASGSKSYIGGVFGRTASKANADQVFSMVNVNASASNNVGGIVGNNATEITNVQQVGKVEGSNYVGGLAGQQISTGVMKYAFTYGKVNGLAAKGNVGGAMGDFDGTATQIFAFNDAVTGLNAATTGKAFGTIDSTVTSMAVVAIEEIVGSSHSTGITNVMNMANLKDELTFKRFGIDFSKKVWSIVQDETPPFLEFYGKTGEYVDGEWVFTDIEKNEIYGEAAIAAVELAEATKLQGNVDAAQRLVDKLDAGSALQNELNERLNVVRAYIEAEKAVTYAEKVKTQVSIDAAQILVDKVTNAADKAALQARLDAIKALLAEQDNLYAEALAAVEKAEATFTTGDWDKTQVDKDAAQVLVSNLVDSDRKTALQDRLNALQKKIDEEKAKELAAERYTDALAAVEKAEASIEQVDVDAARLLVNELPAGAEKTDLVNRLDEVQKLIDALKAAMVAVAKAEKDVTQVDVDNARLLVGEVTDKKADAKLALNNRLDKVQSILDAYTVLREKIMDVRNKVIDGTITVEQYPENRTILEGYRTEANAFTATNLKNELISLINSTLALMKEKEDSEGELVSLIEEAERLVKIAEETIAESDVTNAQNAINQLPESDIRTDLQDRLDKVKVLAALYAEAEKAVKYAEQNPSITNIDAAQPKIDVLPIGDRKDALQTRLDAVLENMFKDAEAKVTKAEGTKLLVDIGTAYTAVNKLPNGERKQALLDRLAAIEDSVEADKAYDEALKAVIDAENKKTLDAIATAQGKVDLVSNADNRKPVLQERLDAVLESMFADAEAKVVKAEGSKTTFDINTAQTAINKLPNGERKQALQNRLDALKQQIELDKSYDEALKAVEKAEKEKTLYYIDAAQAKVDLVSESDSRKPALQERLDAVLEALYTDAEAKVVKAEGTKSTVDINTAQTAVNKLPDGERKQALQNRLDALKQQIADDSAYDAALKAVKAAEANTNATTIGTAQDKINVLRDTDPRKAELQARLDAALAALEKRAISAVEKVEASLAETDLTNAYAVVNLLPTGALKTKLLERLEAIKQAVIDKATNDKVYEEALKAVVAAENNPSNVSIKNAENKTAVVANDDPRKQDLLDRIDHIKFLLLVKDAETAVQLAEKSYLTNVSYVTAAQNKVTALKNSPEKTALQDRLDAVYEKLDDYYYSKALAAVEKAELPENRKSKNTLQPLINIAKQNIDLVKDSPRKTALLDRLAVLEAELDFLVNRNGKYQPGDDIVMVAESVKDATVRNYLVAWAEAIVVAEASYSSTNVTRARSMQDAIPADVLSNPLYADLIQELKDRQYVLSAGTVLYSFVNFSHIKAALNALAKFESDRTEANRQLAIQKIAIAETKTVSGRDEYKTKMFDLLEKRTLRLEIE